MSDNFSHRTSTRYSPVEGRFSSREHLAGKINWEGGIAEAIDYGIKPDDMPEGDTELAEAWTEMVAAYKKFDALAEKVHGLLEEHGLD